MEYVCRNRRQILLVGTCLVTPPRFISTSAKCLKARLNRPLRRAFASTLDYVIIYSYNS